MKFHRRLMLVVPIFLLATASAFAQDSFDWAKKMFEPKDLQGHDFGVVARASEVSYRFKITNLYKQDVRIASVTTTCGCTAPKFDQTPVKSLQTTYIDITMDSNKFTHEKTSNVTVTFDQPLWAVVTFPVKVYIRSDVVVTPNSINFGSVEKGASDQRKLNISYAYDGSAGRADWQIVKSVSSSKHLSARVNQINRGNGQVQYDLVVDLLPTAPVGDLREQINLITDDANSPEIPIIVRAHVESDVTISPSVVQLGSVAPGEKTTKAVVFRGHKPFVLDKVECESSHDAFKMTPLAKDAKVYHILSLTFTAPKTIGPFSEKFIVTVAGRPEPLEFIARGTIEAPQQLAAPQ